MAMVNVSLLTIVILLSSAQANLACNETQCKLRPIGEDVVWKFQELAAENGVRMIYLYTETGNDRYHPLESNERFLANRWVWANTVSEPMLSLLEDKDDFVVYSLGLLENQVRHLTVPLQDQPRGCLARLNTSCQNNVVGRTLLGNFTKVTSDKRSFKAVPKDCVCGLHIVDSAELRLVCCGMKSFTELNNTRVHCELRAQTAWLQVLYIIQNFFMCIIYIYSAALPLLLPDWLFDLQREYEKDNSMENQMTNFQVMRVQQYEVAQRENSDYEIISGVTYLQHDSGDSSTDEQQLRGHLSPDQHHEFEQRVDADATGNEHNLTFLRPIHHFENNANEFIDQHQTRSNQLSNDIHNGPAQREISEQGTNEEDSSSGEERNFRRDSDNENNDDQQQTRSQESDEYQQETEQSVDLEDRTNEESSIVSAVENQNKKRLLTFLGLDEEAVDHEISLDDENSEVGVVINPYGKLLNVVRKDEEAADREIPLDDASPITFSDMLSDYVKELPDFNISFNIKMLFLCFGVLPFFVYLKIALIMFHRMESYREFYQTFQNCSKGTLSGSMFCSFIVRFRWIKINISVYNVFTLTGCVILFLVLLSVRPKDLFHVSRRCPFHCRQPSFSLGHHIIIHLNLLRHWTYDLTLLTLGMFVIVLSCVLRKITLQPKKRPFRSLCQLFSCLIGLLLGTVLGGIFIVIFLLSVAVLIILLSPAATSYLFVLQKLATKINSLGANRKVSKTFKKKCLNCLISFSISFFLFSPPFIFIIFVVAVSVTFVVKTFFWFVMGLVLNAELITPYVAFILVVTRNMYLCYSNLQSRYKEVKDMIAKHWRKNIKGKPWVDIGSDETIPKNLFWFVCGNGKSKSKKNVLPLRSEICFMLRDMALILTFLSLSLFAILVFKSMNDISAVVSTIFVFVSGVIPTLVYQGYTKKEKFSGRIKIKIEKKIKEAVTEYIALAHSNFASNTVVTVT